MLAAGFEFPPGDLVQPLVIGGILAGVGGFYTFIRPTPKFVWCVTALAQLILFSTAFTVFMYCVATVSRPLADAHLAAVDQWFGVYIPDVMAWAGAHRVLHYCLQFAYDTLLVQTALVLIVLGLLGGPRPAGAVHAALPCWGRC